MDQQWEQLRQRCLVCRGVQFWPRSGPQVVFGVGDPAAEVLLGRLPAGIRPGELNWEALTWERETGLFLRRGRLRCRAYFLARAEEGDTVFLDFRLKGAVTT